MVISADNSTILYGLDSIFNGTSLLCYNGFSQFVYEEPGTRKLQEWFRPGGFVCHKGRLFHLVDDWSKIADHPIEYCRVFVSVKSINHKYGIHPYSIWFDKRGNYKDSYDLDNATFQDVLRLSRVFRLRKKKAIRTRRTFRSRR
jgi:hypothetical protein